jgi:VWFA-related protein
MKGCFRAMAVAAGFLAALPPAAQQEVVREVPAEAPIQSELTERVETRIVQIDVTVRDRKGGRASVPGLTKDQFRMRVGTRRLRGQDWERVGFDEVCGPTPEGLPAELDRRHLIVMADFNYLNGQMRSDTGKALRRLADEGIPEGYRVKVVGYTNALFVIQDFTEDPADLVAAALFIETASGLGGPGPGGYPTGGGATIADAAALGRAASAGLPDATAGQVLDAPGPADGRVGGVTPGSPGLQPGDSYAPGELPGQGVNIGEAGGGSEDQGLPTQSESTAPLRQIPAIELAPSLSSDPFKAKGNETNPGYVPPDFVLAEQAFVRDPSAVMLAMNLVPESPGRARVAQHGFWDPSASLAAIEAVLRGHAGLPGRKALALFTGELFEIIDYDDLEYETEAVLRAAQEGFDIWVVDAMGLFSEGTLPGGPSTASALRPGDTSRVGRSRLVTMLANNTGGETLRDASDLGEVFPRIEESLSCYYLFSVPVSRDRDGKAVNIAVSLDTEAHPELFGYTVQHATRLHMEDETTRRENARTAALLNPQDWQTLPLRAELAFPLERDRKLTALPVEVSLPLSALEFTPAENGGVEATFLVDMALDRNGRDTVCMVPPKGEASLRTLRLNQPLPPDARGHLVIRDLCPYRGGGLYTLRAVLTEAETHDPAAARAVYRIEPEPTPELAVAALRAGRNTGQEYLLLTSEEGVATVPRDFQRSAFVPLLEGDTAVPADLLLFRYVLCGPSRDEAKSRLRRLVYRKEKEGAEVLFLLPGAEEGGSPAGLFAPSPFCVEIQDEVPEWTLKQPGEYGFAVLATGPSPVTRSELEEALAAGEGAGLLGNVSFELR